MWIQIDVGTEGAARTINYTITEFNKTSTR
jgi:hypothetical protein